MPTASQFRHAATRLKAAADDAAAVNNMLWLVGQDHGIRGGQLEQLADDAFVANAISAGSLGLECDYLAQLCLERAIACDEYTELLAQYRQNLSAWKERNQSWQLGDRNGMCPVPPGPRPTPPDRPPWVEVE